MKKSVTQMIYVAIFALVLVLLYSTFVKGKSGYTLSPSIESSDLFISSKGGEPSGMTALPYRLECVPGPQADASTYTKSLTPGGYCGIQEFVKAQADYVITGGIGESLLA
jgi:hypothetical protein